MTEIDNRIDRAARAFNHAATDLADALLARLERDAPDIAAKAQQAIAGGERMQLLLEFSEQDPKIVWQSVDDYEKVKTLMTIPGRPPTRQ